MPFFTVRGIMQIPAGGGGGAAIWDPTHVGPDIVLSNGNLTATVSAITIDNGGRSTASTTNQKKFWKITADAISGGSAMMTGVMNGSVNIANPYDLGLDANSVGIDRDGSVAFNGNPVFGSAAGWTAGQTRSFAFDASAKLLWIRTGSGDWNANPSADPATGVGGIDLSASFSGTFYAAFSINGISNQLTADFSGTGAPSGFGAW